MKKIGLTGGIGSGKTYVASIFNKCMGTMVYYSDIRVKKLMTKNPELVKIIKKEFGEDSYLSDGTINRDYLVSKFFMHPTDSNENVKKAEEIVKPFLKDDFNHWCELNEKLGEKYCLFESAIIFENNLEDDFDKIITVVAPLDVRLERIKLRDPFRSNEEIQNLLNKQMSQDEKAFRANFIINNNPKKNLVNLKDQIKMIHNFLVS